VILEICEGQAYDMEFESRDASVDEYILMSEKKTGSLFELCFEIPSLISDDYLQCRPQLKKLGRNLGVVFQMQDDILEMSTSSENMGKGTNSDVERSKKTILSSMALNQDKDAWNKLQEKIKNCSIVEKKQSLKEYYKNSSIIEKSQELLLNFENECKDIIKSFPFEVQDNMISLLNVILKREK
jgi:geranylgeranyl pyrophosphate synthase